MNKLKVLDLFSGIGGFSLGLDRTGGFETVAFCEIEEFPRKVLNKHWPNVPIYEDVRDVTAKRLRADGLLWDSRRGTPEQDVGNAQSVGCSCGEDAQREGTKNKQEQQSCIRCQPVRSSGIDIVTGGFPCQDLSVAGNQKGIEAERSGLWSELCRIIGEVRPHYALIENVTALISGDSGRWFQRVLFDLSEVGYDAEWHHHRDRVWIIAYPNGDGCDLNDKGEGKSEGSALSSTESPSQQRGTNPQGPICRAGQVEVARVVEQCGKVGDVADAAGFQCNGSADNGENMPLESRSRGESGGRGCEEDVPNPNSSGQQQGHKEVEGGSPEQPDSGSIQPQTVPNTNEPRLQGWLQHEIAYQTGWEVESDGPVAECSAGRERHRDSIWFAEPTILRMVDGLPSELHLLGGLNGTRIIQTEDESQDEEHSENYVKWKILRAMWLHRGLAEASPGLYERELYSCVQEVPPGYSYERWNMGARIEKDEGLRDMWQEFYSKPFKEAQDLQQTLLERIGQEKRPETMGYEGRVTTGVKQRAHRLKGLGNAIVPQISELLGRAILEREAASTV